MTVSIKLSAYPAYSRLNSGSKKSLHKIKNFFFTLIKSKINNVFAVEKLQMNETEMGIYYE